MTEIIIVLSTGAAAFVFALFIVVPALYYFDRWRLAKSDPVAKPGSGANK